MSDNDNIPILKEHDVGVALVGKKTDLTNMVLKVYSELGVLVFAESRETTEDNQRKTIESSRLTDISATMVEVLSGHLSNYLNSKDQQGKILSSSPEFLDFIRQSIAGTDPLVFDIAMLDHLTPSKAMTQNPQKGTGLKSIGFTRDSQQNFKSVLGKNVESSFPNITINLEVAVFYHGGVHVAHRGQSQQCHASSGVKKITKEHVAGGLLSALDGMSNLLPSIELGSHKLTNGNRLILCSQGVLPNVPAKDLNKLLMSIGGSPKEQAERIVRALSKYNPENGYVIVVDPYYGKESRKNPEPEPNPEPETAAALLGDNLFADTNSEVVTVSNSQIVEETSLPADREITRINDRLQQKLDLKFSELEEKIYKILEMNLQQIEERLLLHLREKQENTIQRLSTIPGLEHPEDDLLTDTSPEESPSSPLEYGNSSKKRITTMPSNKKALIIGVPLLILFAMAAFFFIDSPQEKKEKKAAPAPKEVAAIEEVVEKKVAPVEKEIPKEAVEPPAPIKEADESAKEDQAVAEKSDAPSDSPYALGEANTRKANYDYGRRLYLEGESGTTRTGRKIGTDGRIDALKNALPYLNRVFEIEDETLPKPAEVWYVKARTEYNLAKHDIKREHYAKLAIKSYEKYTATSPKVSKSKMKTLKRNMRYLKSWAKSLSQ